VIQPIAAASIFIVVNGSATLISKEGNEEKIEKGDVLFFPQKIEAKLSDKCDNFLAFRAFTPLPPMDVNTPPPKDGNTPTSKEDPKVDNTPSPKEEPKDAPKEKPKEESKDPPKEEPKEEPKDAPKEEPKEESKDEPKEEKNKSDV
jgi:outer membrane biosynthesis protein TonB